MISDQTKEAALDPDTSATTTTSNAAVEKDETVSSTATNLEHESGTTEGIASNGAELSESGQAIGESGLKVEKENATRYCSDSKDNFNGQKDRTRNQYPKRQNRSRYDPSTEPVPDDDAARAQLIRNTVDFYFSDSNLPDDAFLLGLTEGSTNLPVKITVIHKFNRMKKYQYADVVSALRDSVTLDVTGPEGIEEIRRKVPYDPQKKDHREPRTVYVKGFGEELPSSQFDIEAFFAQYGPTNSVRLRRTDDKLFKGSCYVEFQDEETAQSFLALDPKPLWKGKHELEIMSISDYKKKKNLAIRNGEMEPNATRPVRGVGKGQRGSGYRGNRDRRDTGDRDPDDWKKRREDDQKSGFRDNRRDRDNRQHNGRGGRGRGRGHNRTHRNNDRNQERNHEDRMKSEERSDEIAEKAVEIADSKVEKEKATKKRTREEDAAPEEAPPKRLDQKHELSADAS